MHDEGDFLRKLLENPADDTTRLVYADLASRIRRLAHGLRSLGVGKGDRVVWTGPNHPAFLETLFAAAKLGAALVPIDHRLEQDAIQRLLDE